MQKVEAGSCSGSGAYRQVEVKVTLNDGFITRITLAVNNGVGDFRIRSDETLQYLFGSTGTLSKDQYGNLLQVSARRGMCGAIITGFPAASSSSLDRVYEICRHACQSLLSSSNDEVALLAKEIDAQMSRPID